MGKKEFERTITSKGEIKLTKVLPVTLVLDGRICDGYTYSCAFRTLSRCFENPEWLLESYSSEDSGKSL